MTKSTQLKLGLVTYNLAKDWEIVTIIKNCTLAEFDGVELRATHGHGVEVDLTAAQRKEIRKRFADSPVQLASLGSAFEYHAIESGIVKENIEGTKQYARLAHDVGAPGIKVRPNGLQLEAGISMEKTLEQIGLALKECGEFAKDYGVEIRLEVHGKETAHVPYIKKIMDYADSDNVFVCWNSNQEDLTEPGLERNFEMVKDKIHFVHMRDLFLEEYPWRTMLRLLINARYRGFCCAEIPESSDPVRVMKYYRALFLAYQDII
ncbi:sugar phosphate isomerase/epimerase [candidate division KSB1 bacterium]|nr:sugar phosphate isomerase/epimerase [candidate division KSB1 bacterium]